MSHSIYFVILYGMIYQILLFNVWFELLVMLIVDFNNDFSYNDFLTQYIAWNPSLQEKSFLNCFDLTCDCMS